MTDSISAAEARRLALAAQGFAARRGNIGALVERLGVVQIDSVNVLVRSHYLPGWSRLGAYDRDGLDALSHAEPRSVFEYWGHAASLLPVELHPLMRWRMALAAKQAWGRLRRMARHRQPFIRDILAIVADKGPIAAGDIEHAEARKQRTNGWWGWSDVKVAIEYLFWAGEVTSARRQNFERLYDLPARVIPAAILAQPTPAVADAHRALVERSARALGVATEADLRDYYRLAPATARPAIAALVEAGALVPVTVEGWSKLAYRHRDTRAPKPIDATALLSPFDSLIWGRERTERMFGMSFRLEIYVPEAKRVHGYYVLPFLLGDRLVARVDLKADRAAKTLRVQAAHAERGVRKPEVATALARELAGMAEWLGLERIAVTRRGDLAAALARASS
jgi:hypothetical protein